MRRRLLSALSLVCGGAAAFFAVWIVVPAPLYVLWLTGIAGTEWSLWWGLLGLVGAVAGVRAYRVSARREGATGIALGVFAAGASLVPLFQSIPVARQNGVALSATRFFLGQPEARATDVPATRTFATVGGQELKLDVYPAQASQSALSGPAIIVVHGGSWSAGDKSDFAHWDRWLSAQGYTIFDIQYRIAPQPNWREATGDVRAAVAWVKRHAAEFHIDPDRIALLGRSAGGHLALLAAYTPRDSRVRTVVSLYGPTDLAWGYAHPARPDVIDGPGTLRRFLGGTPQSLPDVYREASPIAHIGPETPPTLLFHGERDLLVGPQHARRLSAKLATANVPFQVVSVPYALHGFDFNINGWGSQIEQPVLLAFLQKYLAPRPTAQR
jgi:acetyl esterase/lipase